jgi:hypothetical protein
MTLFVQSNASKPIKWRFRALCVKYMITKYIDERIGHHIQGTGARLTQVVSDAGIELITARVWEGKGKDFERRLKNCKKSSRFCPICNPDKADKNMKG